MALFVNQENTRSELQKRVAQELAEKAKKKKAEFETEQPDGVDDSAYLKNTKQTTSLAWVWVLIAVVFLGVIIWLVTLTI